jgi:hypothetical protein
MQSNIQEREYDKFRSTLTGNKSRVATTIEQNKYDPIPMTMGLDDSFGRLKVAPPHLLFDSSFQYSLQDKVFIRDTLLGATITHNPTRASATLSCTSTVGSRARFRTRNYFPYSPAFTNALTGSFNLHGSINGIKRVGLYDERNGFFLQINNGLVQIGVRSSISGSAVDNLVSKADWNVDKLDGSGDYLTNPSGLTLDLSKQNILFIQYQWLGSGTCTFGFVINGKIYKVHEFHHANILTSLYSQTGTLPIQAEIISNGQSGFMEFTCCSLVSNGAVSQHGHLHTASSGTIPKVMPLAGTSYPIISIRKKAGFTDVPIQVLDMNAFSTSQDDFIIQIIHKPVLVGAVWVDVPNSLCQKDVSATSWSGGDVVAEFYMKGNLQASEKLETISKFWDLFLGNDFSGNSEVMSMTSIPLTTNASLYGIISFKEYE